jgi:hypothetical protein
MVGAGLPDLRHDTLDLLDTARRGVLIGGTQAGRQEVLAAEDVERQVELAVMIAMEEPLFLVAVEGQIGRIEIEYDLPGWLRVPFAGEQAEQGIVAPLVVILKIMVTVWRRSRVPASVVVAGRLKSATTGRPW